MRRSGFFTSVYGNVQIQTYDRQKGSLLLLTLVILSVLTLLGVSAVSSTNIGLQIAGNQQRQAEAELVAENTVNFLVKNYPSLSMPQNATVERFGQTVSTGNASSACITKTIVKGSGTPNSLDCSWTGEKGTGNNVTREHESFSGNKSCLVGDYVEEQHPHLHHMIVTPRELWINGNITVKHCGGCFHDAAATIYYTGSNIGSCSYEGSWPSIVKAQKVSQAEFNVATGAGPSVDSDYYSQVEIRVTSTDSVSGATATAVKGFKYRGDSAQSPSHPQCGVTNENIVTTDEDPWLPINGSRRVLYSYLEID